MIGLDTNVVMRFLTQDDPTQSAAATRVFARLTREQPGFVSAVVLAEISWVLARAYKVSREDIAKAIDGLLRSAELIIENVAAAHRALAAYRAAPGGEFSDALIAETAALAGVREVVTFDRIGARDFGMKLLA